MMAIPQQQWTARRADGKKRRHVSWMRRKGRHVELMKPKGRHVAQVCFAPQLRAALLVCISATCRPLRWAAKGRHVDEIDFWTPPSKTRAALFPHGPGKGGTSARWNWADLQSPSCRHAPLPPHPPISPLRVRVHHNFGKSQGRIRTVRGEVVSRSPAHAL